MRTAKNGPGIRVRHQSKQPPQAATVRRDLLKQRVTAIAGRWWLCRGVLLQDDGASQVNSMLNGRWISGGERDAGAGRALDSGAIARRLSLQMEGDEKILVTRARLTLRAERAMGMTAAPVRRRVGRARDAASIDDVVTAAPRARPVERPIVAPTPAPAPVRPAPAAKPTAALAVMPTLIPLSELPPIDGPVMSREQKIAALAALDAEEVRGCTKCPLSATRTQTVFGEGNVDARVMFVGEGPGENEDLQGRPFVGRAGEQLNKQIAAMGLKREDVFIANVVKCRPPGNRTPTPYEVATCTPYLARQIEIIRPEAIITLGLPATQHFLQTTAPMKRLRGVWASWRGIPVMPTYHPAYLLRAYTQENRAAVWSDLKQVMQKLGLTSARGES